MMGKTSMTHEEIINYVKEMDRTNQSVHGDWRSTPRTYLNHYWAMDPNLREPWLKHDSLVKTRFEEVPAL